MDDFTIEEKTRIRDEAVAAVDGRHGYTLEFAPDREAHLAEYVAEEQARREQIQRMLGED